MTLEFEIETVESGGSASLSEQFALENVLSRQGDISGVCSHSQSSDQGKYC